jgi:hypothetical protein
VFTQEFHPWPVQMIVIQILINSKNISLITTSIRISPIPPSTIIISLLNYSITNESDSSSLFTLILSIASLTITTP